MPTFTVEQALEQAWSLYNTGHIAEAESLGRQIIGYQPTNAGALQLVGLILCRNGNFDGGLGALHHAVNADPANPAIRNNFASMLIRAEQRAAAMLHLQEAVRLSPNFAEAYYNIGNIHRDAGEYSKAMAEYARAIQLKPDFPQAQNNLANALKDCGQVPDALAIYRDLLALHPNPRIGSNYVYSMHFDPDVEPRRLLIAHKQWNDEYAAGITAAAVPQLDSDVGSVRKLHIGYVSPDFRNHPVGRFILPLLNNHDRERFEISCYSDVLQPDSMTAKTKSVVAHWHDCAELNDEKLSQKIRADRVHILIDLTMHMDRSRLLMFARRPAPVQATYLAYCSTTGMTAMDYRISDPVLDPPGTDESLYTERTVRLADCYWCYEPPAEAPAIRARTSNEVVFGCLNNFGKVNAAVIATWSEILRKVDNSRLVLFCPAGDHRVRVAANFAEHAIDPQRIGFVGLQLIGDYMDQFQQLDIELDPFPYPGGTTSCDALWMGTPVVTLTGQTAISRSGATILRTIGLPELITNTQAGYIETAVALANQPAKRTELRTSLRQRMQASALMNAPLFARNMESALTEMWKNQRKTMPKQG